MPIPAALKPPDSCVQRGRRALADRYALQTGTADNHRAGWMYRVYKKAPDAEGARTHQWTGTVQPSVRFAGQSMGLP
ncbi:MAG: hypothetical protein JW705_08700 [Methanosarcinaceae archaeon]|nr:hypothetical protein [Methanosarcinaceae archaeon]